MGSCDNLYIRSKELPGSLRFAIPGRLFRVCRPFLLSLYMEIKLLTQSPDLDSTPESTTCLDPGTNHKKLASGR